MLQQILRDMYVDPEILAELGEEQKEMLFYKMRQEQIRRYNEDMQNHKRQKRMEAKPRKRVRILEDRVGDPWTWVFGDTKGEITVEEKWRKARQKREKEAVEAIMKEEERQVAKHKSEKASIKSKSVAARINLIKAKEKANDMLNRKKGIFSESKPKEEPEPPKASAPSRPKTPPNLHKSPKLTTRSTPSPVLRRKERSQVRANSQESNEGLKTPPMLPRAPSPVEVHPMIVQANREKANERKIQVDNYLQPTSQQTTTGNQPPTAMLIDLSPEQNFPSSSGNGVKVDWQDEDLYDTFERTAITEPDIVSTEEWEKQLIRFKKEDERRSQRARRASHEYKRQSIIASDPGRIHQIRSKAGYEKVATHPPTSFPGNKPPIPPKPSQIERRTSETAKPTCREDSLTWFSETQGYAWPGDATPRWFHGIIARQEAESLLEGQEIGNFLVRVSDKIYGYALSYRGNSRIKHFLIDASKPELFHFFGNDQIRHDSLTELLHYHKVEPVTYNGELLRHPVGQKNPNDTDYKDLDVSGKDTRL